MIANISAYANTFQSIMTGAGFGTLASEWWHFEDKTASSQYSAVALEDGVSAECWVKDDNGWRYRTAAGTYYTGSTFTIGETDYVFDEDGYLVY